MPKFVQYFEPSEKQKRGKRTKKKYLPTTEDQQSPEDKIQANRVDEVFANYLCAITLFLRSFLQSIMFHQLTAIV